jgi:MFS family permease
VSGDYHVKSQAGRWDTAAQAWVSDAVTSLVTAGIVYFVLKETHHPKTEGEAQESMAETFKGYGVALRDTAFIWFLGASALMVLVYMQMNTTLAVYLRDVHGVNEVGFSYILSLNAAMVVLFQFWITRQITPYRPLIIMTAGTLLYAIGFAMYGFASWYFFFLVAMVIITVGEMFVSPVGQAIVASLAPEDMRGRYMAVSGFSWVIPVAIGPLMAGIVMDNFDPKWVWYSAGILGVAAAVAFYLLEWRVGRSRWATVEKRVEIIEKLELGEISAEDASLLLEGVNGGSYARLAPQTTTTERRHLRIRVSDLASGAMKVDLRLPVGLVNTVLYAGGHISADLDEYSPLELKTLIGQSDGESEPRHLDKDDERMEVSIE